VSRRPADRLVGVDLARGLALLGMMAVHVLPAQDGDGSASLADQVASGRSAALFAVLAGVGLALAYGRRPSMTRAGAAVLVRAVLIGAVGLLLGLLESGIAVILAYYAVFFVLALPWLRAGPRLLAAAAAVVAVGMPFVSFAVRDELPPRDRSSPVPGDLAEPGQLLSELLLTGYYPAAIWLAYLLAGLAVGRLALKQPATALRLATLGAVIWIAAVGLSALLLGPLGGYDQLADVVRPVQEQTVEQVVDDSRFGTVPTTSAWWLATDAPHTSTPLDMAATIGSSLLVLGLALLVRGRVARLLTPLWAAGSMPLSLYTAHVAFLGLTETDDPEPYYLAQALMALLLATLWRRYVGRGPLEQVLALATRPLRAGRT
jgi:uncharacterized membrane protein